MLYSGALVKKEGYDRFWVVLDITQEDIDATDLNADKPGLYAFGGMQYGNNRYDHDSYGKILPITDEDKLMGDIKTLPSWQLKKMVD